MDTIVSGRDYNMSDAQLALSASNLCVSLTRDLSDFTHFGITAAVIAEFRTLCTDFQEHPSDDSYLGLIRSYTEQKETRREELTSMILDILLRFQDKFGIHSAEVLRLGVSTIERQNDAELLLAARRVRRVAVEYTPQLHSQGMDDSVVEALEEKTAEFEAILNSKHRAESERVGYTRQRIQKGNELYARILTYSSMGKHIYRNRNYAKYADYIIYRETSTAAPLIPSNLRYENGVIRWDAIESASSYQLRLRDSTQQEDSAVYTGSETAFAFAAPLPLPAGVEAYYVRVRGRNAGGFGELSPELRLEVT